MNVPSSASLLLPPLRFAAVEDGLFRGAYPTLPNYRFLRRIRLRTIVSLIPELPVSDLVRYCKTHNITHKHVAVGKYKEAVEITPLEIVMLLELLSNAKSLPLYIHCLDGANVTALVVACLRKLQHYHLNFIFSEFDRHTVTRTDTETEFITNFSQKMCIPESVPIPMWLWGGRRIEHNEHPCFEIVSGDQGEVNVASVQDNTVSVTAHIYEMASFGEAFWSNVRTSLAYYDTLLCPVQSEEFKKNKKSPESPNYSDILQALALDGLTMCVKVDAVQESDILSELRHNTKPTPFRTMAPELFSPLSDSLHGHQRLSRAGFTDESEKDEHSLGSQSSEYYSEGSSRSSLESVNCEPFQSPVQTKNIPNTRARRHRRHHSVGSATGSVTSMVSKVSSESRGIAGVSHTHTATGTGTDAHHLTTLLPRSFPGELPQALLLSGRIGGNAQNFDIPCKTASKLETKK